MFQNSTNGCLCETFYCGASLALTVPPIPGMKDAEIIWNSGGSQAYLQSAYPQWLAGSSGVAVQYNMAVAASLLGGISAAINNLYPLSLGATFSLYLSEFNGPLTFWSNGATATINLIRKFVAGIYPV